MDSHPSPSRSMGHSFPYWNGSRHHQKSMACSSPGAFSSSWASGDPETLALVRRLSTYIGRIRSWALARRPTVPSRRSWNSRVPSPPTHLPPTPPGHLPQATYPREDAEAVGCPCPWLRWEELSYHWLGADVVWCHHVGRLLSRRPSR